MHILNLFLLFVLPANILAAAAGRIVYVSGDNNDANNNTSPYLMRRDSITWGDDDTSQDACDLDSSPQKTGGSEFLKLDCADIIRLNNRWGRWTVNGYTGGKWAIINVRLSCALAVARKDGSTNDFE
ncbi:hypothetical protein diail_5943 [Diaporthe ilicicola]|nr:hypothetical protein diail_5943 [Diaporthe ilicicola]